MAGVFLQKKIISGTPGIRGDRDHLPLIHLCCPAEINDRSEWLKTRRGANPGRQMADLITGSLNDGIRSYRRIIAAVPCNTFHSGPIFSAFTETISLFNRQRGTDIRVLNMIELTTAKLSEDLPAGSRIGILATRGTMESGIWRDSLSEAGFTPLEPDETGKDQVHQLIYNQSWGLKAVYPATKEASGMLHLEISKMKQRGASAVILGCTELPLGAESMDFPCGFLLDPVDCLAEAVIEACRRPALSGGY